MELFKLLSASQIFAQVLSFLFLVFVMRIFVWKKFLKILDDRKARIASELKSIDEARLEVAKVMGEYEKKMGSIDSAANAKIEEAVAEGERIAKEIIEKARFEAEKAGIDSREVISAEIKKAREGLKRDIVDITIAVAEKVIAEKLTGAEDRKLAEDFIQKAEALK
ncbi:MAG: F0F1 ATP synthase subunit B [Candidatus Omnitrophica bacterium]|nr:F0F1 ATP synthase subunit B [Candidatus Omnitrophota bacterium]